MLLFMHGAYAEPGADETAGEAWLMVQAFDGDKINNNDYYSGGAYLYGEVETRRRINFYGRVGLMALVQHDMGNEHEYFGFDGGGGVFVGDELSFFVGAGVLGGKTNSCTREQLTLKDCDDSTVLGAYPEAGLRMKLTSKFIISFFLRRYTLNKELSNFTARGISGGYRF